MSNKYERYAVINTDTGEVVTEVLKAKNEELKVELTEKQEKLEEQVESYQATIAK